MLNHVIQEVYFNKDELWELHFELRIVVINQLKEIFWKMVTGPQGEDAYVSFLQESGHDVVRKYKFG